MKQTGKRLFAVLLTIALCLSLFPVMASAEDNVKAIASLSEITDLSGSYMLSDDITVNEPLSGTFNGTFDGDGHTVTIDISGNGMFAELGANAVVKNFIVDSATVNSSSSFYTGAIAAKSKGTISDIRVKSISVSGMENTGGLVGTLESGATLTRCCIDSGTVKKGVTTNDSPFGGLAGQSSGTVSFSSANVTMDHSTARPNYDYTGGIVGRNNYGGLITDCYFSGSFNESNKSYNIGGICGTSRSNAIKNCYFNGLLESEAGTQCAITRNTTTNCYYLASYTSCDYSDHGTPKTADEFASLAETLGNDWEDGTDGFPVLNWQTWKYSTTAVKYKIETYLESLTGVYELAEDKTVEKKAEPGRQVTAAAETITGFTFDEGNELNLTSGEASAELVLKLYYKRNSNTLTWVTGDYVISSADDEYTHGTVKFGTPIVAPKVNATGMSVKWDNKPDTMPDEDTTITASYAPAIYDVTWDANGGYFEKDNGWGGTEQVETLKWTKYGSSGGAIYGQTLGKYKWNENATSFSNRDLPVPAHANMVFDGWYTAAEDGNPVTADTEVTIPESGSFTYYAHWTEGWKVTFETNGGSMSTSKTVLVRKGDKFGSAIPIPSRSGYTFNGWYNGEDKLEADTVITGDVTYTAKWTPKTYTVTFHANGGEGTMEKQTFTYGVAQKISKNLFTREGYRFLGWATWSGAPEAKYADEEEYSIGSYNQDFYAVWDVIKYKLSFVLTPENAKVVLKNSSNSTQYPESDGSYQLTAGTYTYTVSAEGYETTTGEIVLSKDTELPVALTKIPTYTVAFNIVKPEGVGEPQITVTNVAGKAQTPEEDGTYSLMAGAYTYQIKAAGAVTVRGSFKVEGAALSIDISLTVQTGWDGETKKEPHVITAEEATGAYEDMTGWYRIETGAELAWFANQVNASSYGYSSNAVLAKDIDLGGELWKPIGNSSSCYFSGTFDGAGHTVKNLYCEGTTNQALFGYSKGTIRNLLVSGDVKLNSSSNAMGFEAVAAGVVATQNGGTIENCASYVTVTNLHKQGRSGGVAGSVSSTTVSGCYNAGTLTGGMSIAGIAGYCGGTSTITNCYNIGVLVGEDNVQSESYSTFNHIAGIASNVSEYSTSTISNCYNVGTIANRDKYSRVGAIASLRGAASFSNCFFLEADELKGVGSGLFDGITAVSLETLTSADMPANLGEAYKANTGCGNLGPILTWQTVTEHSFTNAPSDQVATEATCTEPATYYVKCDNCGAVSTELTVAVGEANGHSFTTAASEQKASDATCTEPAKYYVKCDNCDAVSETVTVAVGEPNGHKAGAAVRENEVAATCVAGGSYDEVVYCSVCKTEMTREAKTTDALGHDYVDHAAQAATCTEKGWEAYQTCTRCDYTSYKEIPAKGHTEVIDAAVEATCTEPGKTEGKHCSVCNAVLVEQKVIPAKGHTEVVDAAVEPTCTEPGKTEGKHCSVCNEILVAQTEVPAKGHKYENGVCTVCGAADPEYVPAWVNPFKDVKESDWFYDGVKFSNQNGLFNGTEVDTFSPENAMTRAMLVTVLWRLDGKAEAKNPCTFTDVSAKQYYTEAVAWAAENGIVNGIGDNKFDPDGEVTREQVAAILFRYAAKKGIDTTKRADLSVFPDADQVSGYAQDALAWANAAGLINGTKEGKQILLAPTANATRAQVAAILTRYIQNIVE